jgi:hypothetical protein
MFSYQVKSCCSHDSFILVKPDDRVVREKIQCHSLQTGGRWQRDPRDRANSDKRNEANKPVVKAETQINHLVPCKTQNYWCACQIRQSWYSGCRNYQLPYSTYGWSEDNYTNLFISGGGGESWSASVMTAYIMCAGGKFRSWQQLTYLTLRAPTDPWLSLSYFSKVLNPSVSFTKDTTNTM